MSVKHVYAGSFVIGEPGPTPSPLTRAVTRLRTLRRPPPVLRAERTEPVLTPPPPPLSPDQQLMEKHMKGQTLTPEEAEAFRAAFGVDAVPQRRVFFFPLKWCTTLRFCC